jgi:hypothetical protein
VYPILAGSASRCEHLGVDTLPKEADALFAVSPDDFVDERKRIARALRDDGRREEADAVAALRKPPPVVLAVNRAARDRPEAAKAAVRSAERLGKAQLGSDPDAYHVAATELDDALDLLAQVALAQLSKGGKTATEPVTRRVRALLRNAIADETARTELARGVLREETEAAGFAAFAGVTPPRSAARKSRTGSVTARRKREKEGQERERALRDELARAEKALTDARREEREATRARERAEKAAESLRKRLERLGERET